MNMWKTRAEGRREENGKNGGRSEGEKKEIC